jgi:predicted transcriptional regulator
MRQEQVQYFTETEETCIDLLVQVGMKKNVAKVLVYLAGKPRATTAEIERGTDMSQPEMSLAVKRLQELAWIRNHEIRTSNEGRPVKVYELTKSRAEILKSIYAAKKKQMNHQLSLVKKLQDHLP